MELPSGFAEKVGALSSSTPREAIANLLSAMLPRVQVVTRPPSRVASDVYRDLGDDTLDLDADPELDAIRPNPMRKLRRTRTRKPLPLGRITYIRPNPKRGKSAERYSAYTLGMTAHQAIVAGATAADIQWDIEHNFIIFSTGE